MELLEQYRKRRPAIVFEWSDHETEAEGWVVINSLRNGAAGGGTRMRKGLNKTEVESLAKVMEIKFTVSGPPIGGAKSGINFDPNDPRREEVLKRWYKAVIPLLKHYYGTGGDLNVDEIRDVIPITEDYGLWHPQEGIVNGVFEPKDNLKIQLIGQLRQGVSKKLEDPQYSPSIEHKYTVADMITGWGVAEGVRHFYDIFRQTDISGKRAIIQGWGNVAGAAAYYLAQSGARIVGIIDRNGGLIREEGYDLEEIRELFIHRKGTALSAPDMLSFDDVNDRIWDVPHDIFIPGAASRLVTRNQVERALAAGLEATSCGANVPFEDDKMFFGATAAHLDNHSGLVPDFIANCGMARVFAYLMEKGVEISDAAIFNDVSQTIYQGLQRVHDINPEPTGIAKAALHQAVSQLMDA